ncbi:MAG: Holliday junction DNA helicase RuvA [uncultured bacterium]|uniref:Holliday junction branch migration complex subunit RuvA n=2 Tax=Candidatus Wolfeibacteriota TaxID=1752735 RepID=A0A0G1H8V7_9BACT|nr:MAG: Holliday junction DNA helicase RuvA [uncultured bacterium]KKR12312.1 MAG: Holliday junction ATP-dependent DNA helicase RuvA [Candidatus Wolfebacteria bacterium GW2011_GWC2_39_22]KKT43220.1 MAG: Holliday junction ATP-dependent DNA helicase RuvA [Candidatus Wolfebacteria bacterium GW2011_GWE2_44_13]HBI25942.1 Holliday junction branch migration protein RuvA [Candidatus Wolfebacteria bacterium]
MIYSLKGNVIVKKGTWAVIETNGIGFRVALASRDSAQLPAIGSIAQVFCSMAVKKDGIELYGFLSERDLDMFDLLTTISGVGPKTAQTILGAVGTDMLLATVEQKKTDTLAEFPGIGKKKAERIILELRDKIKKMDAGEAIEFHEGDKDVKDALKQIGYKQGEIDEALKALPSDLQGTEVRLKAALKIIGKHK